MINDKLFYKIVNSQRDCRAQKLTQLQVDGEMLQKSDDIFLILCIEVITFQSLT
jgi:hypothetical protein